MTNNKNVRKTREKCEKIRNLAMRCEINAFDLMEQTTQVVESIVKKEFQKYAPKYGMAVFMHGSPSRNEMTTYSDIDLLFVETTPTVAGQEILKALDGYGFGKVDEQGWRKQTIIEKYVQNSLIDGNKVLDAQFVNGDESIQDWMRVLQTEQNTLDRAIKNIVFQRYYLEHYYSNRSTKEVPNVKYQNGGYRDILMYNWFDNAMGLYQGDNWIKEPYSTRPNVERALNNMRSNGIVSPAFYDSMRTAVEFVILLRNEILHVNQNTIDRNITHLDEKTQQLVLNSSPFFFRKYGIQKPIDVKATYQTHRNVNYTLKMHLWKILLREENKRKGGSWLKRFNDAESGKLTQQTDDPLINIAMVWGINSKKDKTKFNLLAKRSNTNWEVFASIACSELANSATLENIRDRCQSVPEQGYILRIIARNPNASTDTIRKIAEDDKIGIYSIVARKRMAEGLDSAIKRCS